MPHAKGQLSRTMLNERFPHQVIARADTLTGVEKNKQITTFIFSVDGSLQGRSVLKDDEWHRVVCFREREHVEEFQRRFGGEPFDFRLLGGKGGWAMLREAPKPESKLERWQRVSKRARDLAKGR
jgi:hypothetical protein